MTINQALGEFKTNYLHDKDRSADTIENYETAVKSFCRTYGDVQVSDITIQQIRKWKAVMKRRGLASSTVRNYMSKIKNILEYTNRDGLTTFDTSEISLPKVTRNLKKLLTEAEVESMISVSDPRDSAIISLFSASGMRVGEIVRLDRDDIESKSFSVIGKGNKQRPAFMDQQAMVYVNMYLATRKDKRRPLFLTYRKTRMKTGDVQRVVSRAAKKAAIDKRVTPHALRHFFASNMLRKGCDIRHIQRFLGHADISTTQIYTQVVDSELGEIYQKFNA